MEMADLLPDSFDLRQLEDGAPRGGAGVTARRRARRVALEPAWVRSVLRCMHCHNR